MDILLQCPAGIATGGTEGIHNLACYLNKAGANAKIWYIGKTVGNPQPEEYKQYECDYVTEMPSGFTGAVIFPEVWGNQVVEEQYKDLTTLINWQGVDVYSWNVPQDQQGLFLENKSTLHIANSEYAVDYLRKMGLYPIKISDCLNDDFFEPFQEDWDRSNIVLYNPVKVKLTKFQKIVMARCTTELGVKFRAVQFLSRSTLRDLFRHSKLYIDFGVFSGRERLPREAVMSGCCILTSNLGTAGWYDDNSIPGKYRINDIDKAVEMVGYVLNHYNECRADFDYYRQALEQDKKNYPEEVRRLYHAILNHHPSV